MKKNINYKNKFSEYANHLNKHVSGASQHLLLYLHNINKADMEKQFMDFYKDFPEFSVEDCEEITRLLNIDYVNYIKWMHNG